MKFVPDGPFDHKAALVYPLAWCRIDRPESMMPQDHGRVLFVPQRVKIKQKWFYLAMRPGNI